MMPQLVDHVCGVGHSSGRALRLNTAVFIVIALALLWSIDANANERDRYKRIYDRLAGVPPTLDILNTIVNSPEPDKLSLAANEAMQNPAFYNVTLKNFASPWTNEAQSVFEKLNDYSATVIGMIRDDVDFRGVLYEDIIYTGGNINTYSHSDNNLYENLEDSNADLSNESVLIRRTQSEIPGGPLSSRPQATAGVMTTRAAARAFYIDGTNRAMFRFTLLNHLCYDMEQIKDNTRTADRIRQDVSRSPGGDSRIFFANCLACHAGMDPMVQAFAYYEWDYKTINPNNPDVGRLAYTPELVQPKYHINENNFKGGYITPDDHWSNYWRHGPNAWLGWGDSAFPPAAPENQITIDDKGVSHGNGPKSLGMELAHSDAFARCQVKKVFKTVCLRSPDSDDSVMFEDMVSGFKTDFKMKEVFRRAAIYCSAE